MRFYLTLALSALFMHSTYKYSTFYPQLQAYRTAELDQPIGSTSRAQIKLDRERFDAMQDQYSLLFTR